MRVAGPFGIVKAMAGRPVPGADRQWITRVLAARWGSTTIVVQGHACDAAGMDGLVAVEATGTPVSDRSGLFTSRTTTNGLGAVTLDSLRPRRGIGTALVSTVAGVVGGAGAERILLFTMNDDLDAIGFFSAGDFA